MTQKSRDGEESIRQWRRSSGSDGVGHWWPQQRKQRRSASVVVLVCPYQAGLCGMPLPMALGAKFYFVPIYIQRFIHGVSWHFCELLNIRSIYPFPIYISRSLFPLLTTRNSDWSTDKSRNTSVSILLEKESETQMSTVVSTCNSFSL